KHGVRPPRRGRTAELSGEGERFAQCPPYRLVAAAAHAKRAIGQAAQELDVAAARSLADPPGFLERDLRLVLIRRHARGDDAGVEIAEVAERYALRFGKAHRYVGVHPGFGQLAPMRSDHRRKLVI